MSDRGSAVVEFALVVPLIVLVLLATAVWWAPFGDMHLHGAKAVWLSIPFWASS